MNEFKKRYNKLFGNNSFEKIFKKQYDLNKNVYLRINKTKIEIGKAKKLLKSLRLKVRSTIVENCISIYKPFFSLSSLPYTLNGYFYIQDLSSQIPIYMLFKYIEKENKKKLKILDIASAPGGKITQLSDYLTYSKIDYKITAIDNNLNRIKSLMNNIQKQSLNNIKIHHIDFLKYNNKEKLDIIIADVPCSGNFIIDKNWFKKRNLKGINKRSEIQKKMLKRSYDMLKKNGVIVYSTCSMEPEENELICNWFLKNFKVISLKPYNLKINNFILKKYKNYIYNEKTDNFYRLLPHLTETNPFFFAFFKKIN